jgi:hypothetical protein
MLVAMDIPTAAGPWIVLGVVIGMLVLVLAGLGTVVLFRSRPPAAPADPPPSGYGEDDLPGFLESPPGTGTGTQVADRGWTALSPAPPAPPASAADRGTGPLLAALGVTALLLIGAAAAIAAVPEPAAPAPSGSGDSRADGTPLPPVPAAPSPGQPGAGVLADAAVPLGREWMAADLTFGGVVLEARPVGVTATYPELGVSAGAQGALAHLRLPTWNCLAAEAPEDPVAAGCRPSVTEYADLPSPALHVTEDGDGWRITGRFPTYTRPNGTPPVWTGRVYELSVTVTARDGERGTRVPAAGVLRLGDDRAGTTDEPDVNVLHSGG